VFLRGFLLSSSVREVRGKILLLMLLSLLSFDTIKHVVKIIVDQGTSLESVFEV